MLVTLHNILALHIIIIIITIIATITILLMIIIIIIMMIIHLSINKGTTSMRTTGGPLHQKPLISYVRCSAWINPRYDDEDDD